MKIRNSGKPLIQKVPLKAQKTLKRTSGKKVSNKKPVTVSQLKRLADKYFSKATRLRFATFRESDWWAECITCHAPNVIKNLQCGHFMSRTHNSTRYSEENCAPQCYGCNVMHQGRQYQFGLEIDSLYGAGTARRLYEEAKIPHQFTADELLQVMADSKEQIKFYTSSVLDNK